MACLLLLPLGALAGDYERGIDALDKKDYDLAITCFDAHLRDHPGDAGA
jgi:TolA-binding protein